jgi:hypothetical protein
LKPPTSLESSGMAIETDPPGDSVRDPEVYDRSPANAETAMVPTTPVKVVAPVLAICRYQRLDRYG